MNRNTLEETWDYYEMTRDSLTISLNRTRNIVLSGSRPANHKFNNYTLTEINNYYNKLLSELDMQVSLVLIATAEATVQVDYLKRVQDKLRDPLSRDFRAIDKRVRFKRGRMHLDTDILDSWKKHVPLAKSEIGEFDGSLNYRHWLAHGRYWTPRLGRKYDPIGIIKIITDMFSKIGL